MVKRYTFLFPGQGAQYPGMAKDLYEASGAAKKLLDDCSEILNMDVRSLMWDSDAQKLSRSDCSQIAITCASLAASAALSEKGIEASVCAGFSLGEWPALCRAGVLTLEDTLRLVSRRGEIMQSVCEEIAASSQGEDKSGMAAVMGLPPDKIKEIVSSSGIADLYAVNLNSPVQTVISGTGAALAAAGELFKQAGARRVVRLMVAGPFHSPLMEKAAVRYAEEVEKVAFRDPVLAVFSNVTGARITSGADAKKYAARHITHPVRWTDEEAAISSYMKSIGGDTGGNAAGTASGSAADGEWCLLETGPGKVLSGLWRDSGCEGVCSLAGTAEAIAALEA